MTYYKLPVSARLALVGFLVTGMFSIMSCRKENRLEPSRLDNNYFVINDNPDDPIDHAIYQFYKNTGVASFYRDSISKKRIDREDGDPASYTYIKLSLQYTLLGSKTVFFKPLSSRNSIPALLDLMEEEMLPRLPSAEIIPSILFVDSFWLPMAVTNIKIAHGWTALYGFNTIGVVAKDVTPMNSDERKMYAASMLAGIAENRINKLYSAQLQKDFYSVTRALTKTMIPVDIYLGFPYMYVMAANAVPLPQNIGLLHHPMLSLAGQPGQPVINMPRELDDLRAFLTAAFYYTDAEFADLHANDPHVLNKFNLIRSFVRDAGFKLPD